MGPYPHFPHGFSSTCAASCRAEAVSQPTMGTKRIMPRANSGRVAFHSEGKTAKCTFCFFKKWELQDEPLWGFVSMFEALRAFFEPFCWPVLTNTFWIALEMRFRLATWGRDGVGQGRGKASEVNVLMITTHNLVDKKLFWAFPTWKTKWRIMLLFVPYCGLIAAWWIYPRLLRPRLFVAENI